MGLLGNRDCQPHRMGLKSVFLDAYGIALIFISNPEIAANNIQFNLHLSKGQL